MAGPGPTIVGPGLLAQQTVAPGNAVPSLDKLAASMIQCFRLRYGDVRARNSSVDSQGNELRGIACQGGTRFATGSGTEGRHAAASANGGPPEALLMAR